MGAFCWRIFPGQEVTGPVPPFVRGLAVGTVIAWEFQFSGRISRLKKMRRLDQLKSNRRMPEESSGPVHSTLSWPSKVSVPSLSVTRALVLPSNVPVPFQLLT